MSNPLFPENIKNQPEHIQRIAENLWMYEFDNPNHARSILDRICLEQGWSREFGLKAIEEYRRFCLMAIICDHSVTPSEEVDAVWHTHLLYTRDYWKDFCPNVLGREFHHGPTQGGKQESVKFYDQYSKTLYAYKDIFKETPPEDFWPSAHIRFRPSRLSRWVFLPDYWVIPKPNKIISKIINRFK